MDVLEIFGAIMLVFGFFFFFVGVVGIVRLPDVHSRLHASGKVATLGFFGLLVGGGFLFPEFIPRLILLGLFYLMSAPTASHVIALTERKLRLEKEQLGETGQQAGQQ
jgi:multicomponent Na+:H+ antiporter subunit G